MTQIARKVVIGNKNFDGYKPNRIPNALKVIHGKTKEAKRMDKMELKRKLESKYPHRP